MYAGHLGFALGAYSYRRTLPLWLLLVASQIPDWLDAGACIADVDRGGPFGLYTHGWLAVGLAAIACSAIAFALTRDVAGALLVALVEASHYPLDYLTGLKPTWPGGPIIGLNLYSRPMVDLALEGAVILAGWLLYRRTLPESVRNDGMTYAVLFALLTLQIIAG
ncbi:MAG TPA: hypothetical protein VGT98_10800, partial [Candidatus Elarobacter sp.]|nr:hypothetical protein [Candidatus Elarobacter sp.]